MKTKQVKFADQLWLVDPLNQYDELPARYGMTEAHLVIHHLGLTHSIIDLALAQSDNSFDSFISTLEMHYGYRLTRHMGGTIDSETLTFKYPEDPDLHPLLSIQDDRDISDDKKLTFVIYPFSIVYIKIGEQSLISRMD